MKPNIMMSSLRDDLFVIISIKIKMTCDAVCRHIEVSATDTTFDLSKSNI